MTNGAAAAGNEADEQTRNVISISDRNGYPGTDKAVDGLGLRRSRHCDMAFTPVYGKSADWTEYVFDLSIILSRVRPLFFSVFDVGCCICLAHILSRVLYQRMFRLFR